MSASVQLRILENLEPKSDNSMKEHDAETLDTEKSSVCSLSTEEKEETEKDESETDGVPYDRGWAWAVMFGCFIDQLLIAGYYKCSTLFYVELLYRFNAKASQTGLLFSIRAAVTSVGALFVMNMMVPRLGVRKTVLTGAILSALSGILPSLTNEMMLIICLNAVLHGIGQSMQFAPGDVLLGAYFKKRHYMAMALSKCGVSVGNILMPLLVTYFLENYGLSGALLLTGGFYLHAVPAALLMRPVSFFKKRLPQRAHSKKPHETRSAKYEMIDEDQQTTEALIRNDGQGGGELETKVQGLASERAVSQTVSESHVSSTSGNFPTSRLDWSESDAASNGEITGPLPDAELKAWDSTSDPCYSPSCNRDDSLEANDGTCSDDDQKVQLHTSSLHRCLSNCSKNARSVLDFSLFTSPVFCLLQVYALVQPSVLIMYNYLPAMARENGVTESQTALLLSVMGGLGIVCRVLCAVLGNANILTASSMICITSILVGVMAQFTAFMTSFYHFLALSVFLGLIGGVPNTMLSALVLDLMGLEKMGKTLGFIIFIAAASSSGLYPLLGYVRDVTGSYVAVYHVLGCGALVSAGLLLSEKWVRRLENRKHA